MERPNVISSVYSSSPPMDTPLDDGDFNIERSQLPEYVEIGRVAFHRGAECEYYLFYSTGGDSVYQTFDFEVGRTYAVHRGDDPPQYVIKPVELASVLDYHHLFHIFDNA